MNKKYKLVFIGLGVYIVLMGILLIYNHYSSKEKGIATIFIDNSSTWVYSSGKWAKIPSREILNYNWKKYKLYYDHKYFGDYYLMKNNSDSNWYMFDDNKASVDWKSGIVAFGGNIKVDPLEIKQLEIPEDEYKYSIDVLKSFNIKDTDIESNSIKIKYLVDLDKDGENESIYAISNVFTEKEKEKNYSIVFYRKNNKNIVIYQLINDFDKSNYFSGCMPDVSTIFNIGRDNNPKLVVNCEFYSGIRSYNYLYGYNNKTNEFDNILIDLDTAL